MKHNLQTLKHLSLPLLCAGLLSGAVQAGEQRESIRIVKVQTADAEVVEADVTDLALGESKSFVTESGHTVDLLQAPEGLEIYIDGELMDAGHGAEELHERLAILHEHVAGDCDTRDGTDCERKLAYVYRTGDGAETDILADGMAGDFDVEIVCTGDEDCDQHVWIAEDGLDDLDLDVLHEGNGARVIVIEKDEHVIRED